MIHSRRAKFASAASLPQRERISAVFCIVLHKKIFKIQEKYIKYIGKSERKGYNVKESVIDKLQTNRYKVYK